MARKLAPALAGLPETPDSASVRASILSYLSDGRPRSANALAKTIGAPLLLTQKVCLALARGKKLLSAGSVTEDGEVRILFKAKGD